MASMTHPKFGNKYTCFSCSTKYYDMKKSSPVCPKCGADPKDDPALKTSEKKGKGPREELEADEFEGEETFEADMDELVNDDAEEADDEPEEEVERVEEE